MWIHDDIDAPGFKARVIHDTVLLLLPLADDARRPRLLRRLREARRALGGASKLSAAIPINTNLNRKKDSRL